MQKIVLEGLDLVQGEKILTTKHKCQVKEKLNALRERYPGNGKMNKIKRGFMFFFITHRNIKWKKKIYKSDYEFYYEQKKQLFNSFTIHAESIFRSLWNLIMLIVSITILFYYPVYWSRAYIKKDVYDGFYQFQLYAEIFTWMDILFNFFTTFYDDNDELVVDRGEILKNYMRHRFIIDLLVALPTTLFEDLIITEDTPEEKLKCSYYIYINIFFILKILRYVPFSHYFYSIFAYIIKRQTILLVLKAQIGFIIFLHWTSCVVTVTSSIDAGIVFTDGKNGETNWLLEGNKYKFPFMLLHGLSVLRAMSYMFNIDYVHGIITDVEWEKQHTMGNVERLYASITAIGSQILFFFYICLCNRAHKTMHSSQHKYRRLIRGLKSYIEEMNFNPQMTDKIMTSFRVRFGDTYFKDKRFNDDFATLRCFKVLESIDLFQEFSKQALMKLAAYLITETYFPGDIIEIPLEIALVFLSNGTIAVYSEDGIEFRHLEDGSYFGFNYLFVDKTQPQVDNIFLCLELCTIYQLPKMIFMNIIKDYPHILVKLEREIANFRHDMYKHDNYQKYSQGGSKFRTSSAQMY